MLFSSLNTIRGVYLKSKLYFSVPTEQSRVIGISHNGHQVYWTEINKAEAAIVKSNEDGSNRVVIADSGNLFFRLKFNQKKGMRRLRFFFVCVPKVSDCPKIWLSIT